jgi:S-adenosylmethionine:tRNA ribosyltransferase-isomerase
VQISDFDFDLPPELVAQRPLAERSASRLLAVDPPNTGLRDFAFADLPPLLDPGDVLVFNDTRVVPARLVGRRPSGGRVEILLERAAGADGAWVQMRASKPLRPGQIIHAAGGDIVVRGREGDLFEVGLPAPAIEFFTQHGAVPLPPYIQRDADADDVERYQSVLARVPGAVAAPTASLHFDEALLRKLDARGVRRATVTLHVGAGTFQPLRTERIEEHRMHSERAEVPPETCEAVAAARAAGRRVVAVGTTVVRALESAAANGDLQPRAGDTSIFIRPGYRWRVVDAMVTNFHLPRSTLLMLVAAFAGLPVMQAAYAHAVARRYRFFSYGDAMFIERRAAGGDA